MRKDSDKSGKVCYNISIETFCGGVMKAFWRIVLVVLTLSMLACVMLSLVSCSTRLDGTYASSSSSSNMLTTTYVFEGKTVRKTQTLTYNESSSTMSDITGKYKISYSGTITFIWDDAGTYAGKTEEERTETYEFLKTNTYIRIGTEYYSKQSTTHDHDHT